MNKIIILCLYLLMLLVLSSCFQNKGNYKEDINGTGIIVKSIINDKIITKDKKVFNNTIENSEIVKLINPKNKDNILGDNNLIKNCNQLGIDLLVNKCNLKKLKELFNFRYKGLDEKNFYKLNCEGIFNPKLFLGVESAAKNYLSLCRENRKKDFIFHKKNQSLNKKINLFSPLEYCSKKLENYNKSDKSIIQQNCEYFIALKKGCDTLVDITKISRCNEIKKNINSFSKMKKDYSIYGDYKNFD